MIVYTSPIGKNTFTISFYIIISFRQLSTHCSDLSKKNNTLYAIVEQLFVKATAHIDLDDVKEFLKQNGFENKKIMITTIKSLALF